MLLKQWRQNRCRDRSQNRRRTHDAHHHRRKRPHSAEPFFELRSVTESVVEKRLIQGTQRHKKRHHDNDSLPHHLLLCGLFQEKRIVGRVETGRRNFRKICTTRKANFYCRSLWFSSEGIRLSIIILTETSFPIKQLSTAQLQPPNSYRQSKGQCPPDSRPT